MLCTTSDKARNLVCLEVNSDKLYLVRLYRAPNATLPAGQSSALVVHRKVHVDFRLYQ